MYKQARFVVEGVTPTLMHNGQLANPLNPFVKDMKRLTSKTKKSEDDHIELGRLEFLGSLYQDKDGTICWPAENIHAAIVKASKLQKRGVIFERAIFVDDDVKFEYKGPKDPDKMWEDPDQFVLVKKVRVKQASVMRTRPIFREWKLSFTIHFTSEIDLDILKETVEACGMMIGISDWRPRYGRFQVLSATNGKAQ